jgi:hypothetical protein
VVRPGKLRPSPIVIVLTVYDVWRRLPPKQRKQVLRLARDHGPKAAMKLLELRRTMRRPK